MRTLEELARALADGRTTAAELVEECLRRISDPAGEGARTYLLVDVEGARASARAMDALRQTDSEPSPYAGIPVSIKDLFDVRGQVTRAGSRVLEGPPATRDAAAVARWRRAGLVLVGRTNMTEFAFSGLGLNPHHGTPASPWDRPRRRIPGGSSSGAAVSVADGMAHAALGTDTGGSCRIPAALCGIVGWKPTQTRVPREGVVPLAPTLDTVGVLARSVGCVAVLDALLRGAEPQPSRPLPRPPRLAVPRTYVLDELDEPVAADFARAAERLRAAGAELVELELAELAGVAEINAAGGFAAPEALAWHRELMAGRGDGYDPRVLARIRGGERQTASTRVALCAQRRTLIDGVAERLEGFDAFVCPTTPCVAPPIDALADDEEAYVRTNLLVLRNPTVVNLLDGCAISLPMHAPKAAPTGLMVAALNGHDERLLRVAAWIEGAL